MYLEGSYYENINDIMQFVRVNGHPSTIDQHMKLTHVLTQKVIVKSYDSTVMIYKYARTQSLCQWSCKR